MSADEMSEIQKYLTKRLSCMEYEYPNCVGEYEEKRVNSMKHKETSVELDRKSTRLNSSHSGGSRMPSSA